MSKYCIYNMKCEIDNSAATVPIFYLLAMQNMLILRTKMKYGFNKFNVNVTTENIAMQ